jgi:lambda repressor-like predicted transcriptional regulator
MDERIASLIEKTDRLGWTLRQVAEKADLSYAETCHVLRRKIYNETYVSKLTIAIDDALGISKKPKKKKWSSKYDRCINCGEEIDKHVARGLCVSCYNQKLNNKFKNFKSIKEKRLLKKVLTKEYLVEEYLVKEKSLADIANELSYSRQGILKKMKSYGIQSRDLKTACAVSYKKGKVIGQKNNEADQTLNLFQQKKEFDKDFFSSWSNEMAYVLGMIFSDGN